MNLNPFASALRTQLRDAYTKPQDAAASTADTEPLRESELALEIARIMERPFCSSSQSCHSTQPRWLGDDIDNTIVEAYALLSEPHEETEQISDGDAAQTVAQELASVAEPEQVPMPANHKPASNALWVRHARRARFRTKLNNAAGWVFSFAVSLLLIAIASFAMYGWPDAPTSVRQMQLKPIKVSTRNTNEARHTATLTHSHISGADLKSL